MSIKYEYSDYCIYDFGTKLLPSSAILLEGGCKLRNLSLFQLTLPGLRENVFKVLLVLEVAYTIDFLSLIRFWEKLRQNKIFPFNSSSILCFQVEELGRPLQKYGT